MENNLHRSQALKLNEMYSSYSFLKKIYEMHADFVSTFEHFLRNPTDEIKENYSENYEKQYIMYLNVLNNQEKALELLVYGWGGVFLVIGIIYLASKLLGKAFPQNK